MTRVALVLGAGGEVGHAFHAGVLQALTEVTGFDPDAAEVIVGTSAGAHAGALLRGGLSPGDIAARLTGAPPSGASSGVRARIGPPRAVPPPEVPTLSAASPRLMMRGALRPWTVRPGAWVAAALPRGRVSLEPFAVRLRWLFGEGWSPKPLWLTAVRLDTGRRVVFGQPGAPRTDVGTAVAASCAVPGWFRPVRVDGVQYVDGGAHSVTNLDVVAGMGLDLVVVSVPMGVARGAWRPSSAITGRGTIRLRLREEALRVRRGGTEVVAFSPTADDLAVMGTNAMDSGRRAAVVRRARESALRRLEQPDLRSRLTALTQPSMR